jgi:cyclin-dependent kinase 7
MKDGLDMTALREVKFLQELHHPNIIGVSSHSFTSLPHNNSADTHSQLLDVFSVKQNINLVLEFLDTDLEAVIRDKSLVFQTADIKSWMAMSFRGLEYIHRYGVLHRVSAISARRGAARRVCLSLVSSLSLRVQSSGVGAFVLS